MGHVEHYAGDQMYIDFAAFAEHYGCAVYPARVRHPKDKALVENAVKLMYKSVYADIESLNTAIQSSLEKFNSKQMSNRKESRRELFEEIEKDYFRPLPPVQYQMRERKSVTVMRNSYVTLGKHHFSVQ